MSARLLFAVAFAVSALFAGSAAHAGKPFKNAQMAVHFDGLTQVHKHNVKLIKNPAKGIYCIRPTWPNNTIKHILFVSTEVDTSGSVDSVARWAYSAGNCKNSKHWFEVRTYERNGSGDLELSDSVSFTAYVP